MNSNFICNLVPIYTGGGLQNANSFVEALGHQNMAPASVKFLVRANSSLEASCRLLGFDYLSFESSYLSRIAFELLSAHLFKDHPICFTLFGPPPISSIKKTTNVIGCAYSNLFYPEISFWAYLDKSARFVKESIDRVRRHYIKAADFWIFETEAIQKRAVELCNFPEDRVAVVKMAPSGLVSKRRIAKDRYQYFRQILPHKFNILYLSGAHPNKRLHLLPGIAESMVRMGFKDFAFITTMDTSSPYAQHVISAFINKKLKDNICNIGPIPPHDVASLIAVCDAMCNLSLLESFSNNYIEAWQMDKPLIVTAADWTQDLCGEAAIYVNPNDPKNTSASISELAKQSLLTNALITAGQEQLHNYNTPETKLEQYLELIEKACHLGPLPNNRRRHIRWIKPQR